MPPLTPLPYLPMKDVVPIYKRSLQNIREVLIALLFLNCLSGYSKPSKAEEVRILPPITVFATRKPDNTFVQRSEVEWHKSNDSTITKEVDGTYTARDTTNSYSLKSLIVSLGSPAVSIDISYAANSTSMTADGRLALATLIKSLGYLDKGTKIHLTPVNKPYQTGKTITRHRVKMLRETLTQQNRDIDFKFMPSKTLTGVASKSKRSDLWRIQIQRKI